jgi:glycosyltransferase involved in cell wall biosynthesis
VRILYLVHQYPPENVGGTELYTRSLARELHRRGHEVGIFFRRNEAGKGLVQTLDDGIRLYVANDGEMGADRRFLTTFGNSTLDKFWETALDDFRPELIHVQHLMGLPASLLSAIKARSLPVVVTLHDYWWFCANAQMLTNYDLEPCTGPKAYVNCARCAMARANNPALLPAAPLLPAILAWRTKLLRRWLDWASVLIVSMEFVRDRYVDQGIDPGQLTVIPLGVDVSPPAEPVASGHDGVRRFLYIGGIAYQKGVHIVLEAFRQLEGAAELWIVGDESVDMVYAQQLHELSSGDVRFFGKVPHAEVWELLAQADMLLMPSIWYETFGLVIYEAFAAGLPVMASDLGVMADAVRHDVDGMLVRAGDVDAWRQAMQRAVNEPERLVRYGEAIRRPFTVAGHVEMIESHYVATTRAANSHSVGGAIP